jgi:superfamily II DNA/RNA helicase
MDFQLSQQETNREAKRDQRDPVPALPNPVLSMNSSQMYMAAQFMQKQREMMMSNHSNEEVEIVAPYMTEVPPPLTTFNCEVIPENIRVMCGQMGFKEPTLIQKYCIPISAAGVDLIALAKTGSGKTLAYMIP